MRLSSIFPLPSISSLTFQSFSFPFQIIGAAKGYNNHTTYVTHALQIIGVAQAVPPPTPMFSTITTIISIFIKLLNNKKSYNFLIKYQI